MNFFPSGKIRGAWSTTSAAPCKTARRQSRPTPGVHDNGGINYLLDAYARVKVSKPCITFYILYLAGENKSLCQVAWKGLPHKSISPHTHTLPFILAAGSPSASYLTKTAKATSSTVQCTSASKFCDSTVKRCSCLSQTAACPQTSRATIKVPWHFSIDHPLLLRAAALPQTITTHIFCLSPNYNDSSKEFLIFLFLRAIS